MTETTVGTVVTTTVDIGIVGIVAAGIAIETGTVVAIGTARAETGIALTVTVVKGGDQIPAIVGMAHEDIKHTLKQNAA